MKLTRISVYIYLLVLFLVCSIQNGPAIAQQKEFTRQDRLRGSISPERAWWDLQHYHLTFEIFPEAQTLQGTNEIRLRCLSQKRECKSIYRNR